MDERTVQDRLVEAAEVLFCQRGFDDTGVREIAAAAGCNVASINYYFGGKDRLYVEVWRRQLGIMRETRTAGIRKAMSGNELPSLEELLKSYARSFFEPLADESGLSVGQGHCRFVELMIREMVDPRLPADMFVTEMVSPVMAVLTEAIQTVCPWLKPPTVQRMILSVVGQLVYVVAARRMFERCDCANLPRLNPEEMIDHIVRFSAAAIRGYEKGERE
ncbi:MAG: CerR family C-terminal domain-containing protein [Sedimentisphaerales bacterium]|jgi:AcrR family transcriptional regulator|nr:CerR family C-terminal domain-containing protein [Sedimentisphaerales bacterium]NLZ04033.1 CerR family C-terminal domain-containing protein [Phycisphaerae bacterium]HNY80141.1 CerR family C-terminal domain-containing protein [Sedimentisphaerales bacterium]HOC65208.1 CerR family C-terminal domain-containing protein [Sedimentisphaerales bacterium]HOH66693.1 CerR family C-terminal domain-containing protein [Sedimentisphaerales bacterium]